MNTNKKKEIGQIKEINQENICSNLWGDCSDLSGDCTDLNGGFNSGDYVWVAGKTMSDGDLPFRIIKIQKEKATIITGYYLDGQIRTETHPLDFLIKAEMPKLD
jgi:hypothetical protein